MPVVKKLWRLLLMVLQSTVVPIDKDDDDDEIAMEQQKLLLLPTTESDMVVVVGLAGYSQWLCLRGITTIHSEWNSVPNYTNLPSVCPTSSSTKQEQG